MTTSARACSTLASILHFAHVQRAPLAGFRETVTL